MNRNDSRLSEWELYCDDCGDAFYTWKSHRLFCRGQSEEPWKKIELNEERLAYWMNNPVFVEWATKNKLIGGQNAKAEKTKIRSRG